MKTKYILVITALCAAFGAAAQQQTEEFTVRDTWHECSTEMATARILDFGEEVQPVRYSPNIVYAAAHGEALTLQIVRQIRQSEPMPCVIFIQGSAWMKQDTYSNIPMLSRFAERGYVVAMVQYTHSGLAPFPAALQDVKSAIRYMRKNADKWGVDPDNIFLWGDSSGGHLTLMTALAGDVAEYDSDLYTECSTEINAFVAYYPVTDLLTMHNDPCASTDGSSTSFEGKFLANRDVDDIPEEALAASPVSYVDASKPTKPIMIAVGTCDHIVPFSQSEMMAKKLDEAGKDYQYYVVPGADHGSWQFWTPQMFDIVDSFFSQYKK